MEEKLPEEFDLIVIGTGFSESCVAAAASRIGKTVLHIDVNAYYGGIWASFALEDLNNLLDGKLLSNGEIRNATYQWHIPNSEAVEANKKLENEEEQMDENQRNVWTKEKLLQLSRKFNLDLCPKVLYSSGTLVQLLISSNICRYAEFRAVDSIYTKYQGKIMKVPCSRSDVFNTKDLDIVEKRLLMKFLNLCQIYGEDKCSEDMVAFAGKTFLEYLQQQQLTEKIYRCILQAIAMSTSATRFEDGMRNTQHFLQSLGKYGNTPFLFPMYGCGEIPQCFCRLCAVFGGVYCLNKSVSRITSNSNDDRVEVEVELENGKQMLHARHVVCSAGNLPEEYLLERPMKIALSRAIFLTSAPLTCEQINAIDGSSSSGEGGGGGGGISLLRLLSDDDQQEAILLQLSHSSGTCPKDIYIFHLITMGSTDDPLSDLQPFVKQIFDTSELSQHVLYSCYFTIYGYDTISEIESRIFTVNAPVYELDYDANISNARYIFEQLYGKDCEYLPRAPDPEEIIIEGENPSDPNECDLPENLRMELQELTKTAERMNVKSEEATNMETD